MYDIMVKQQRSNHVAKICANICGNPVPGIRKSLDEG